MSQLIAFHGDAAIKQKYIERVRAHRKAEQLVRGIGWASDKQKGCAVGCTLNQYNHAAYETELGIPEWLAHLEDTLYEGMPLERSKRWPEEFLEAIPVGANLESVKAPFLIFVLESVLDKFDHAKFPEVKRVVDTVIALYRSGETDLEKFRTAAEAAEAAEAAARAAAEAAARAAAEAAAWAARATAEAAAWAEAAARAAARAAAEAAARAAAEAAARAAARAAEAAEAAEHQKFADKLLELLRGVK